MSLLAGQVPRAARQVRGLLTDIGLLDEATRYGPAFDLLLTGGWRWGGLARGGWSWRLWWGRRPL